MADGKPSPHPRAPVTQTWETGWRQRICVLTSANQALTTENVGLHRENTELWRRLAGIRNMFEPWYDSPLARRVLRILDGDLDSERHASGDGGDVVGGVAGLPGDRGPQDAGGVVAGGGPVPAGGVEPAADAGGDGGVPGAVGSVAAWPYGRTDVA